MQRLPKVLFFALLFFSLPFQAHAAPGDILSSFTINNTLTDGRLPSTPQGITYYNGQLYIVDFASDRIYRTFPSQVLDADEVTVLFEAGDSDFNIPLTDADNPPINSDGIAIGTCSSATPAGQYCGGGGITFAENFLWNASPITDDIIKIDPVDGDNLETENALASLAFPAPTDMTYDGTYFWIVDWQTNTINKVLPEDGTLISSIPGPSTKPSYTSDPGTGSYNAKPFGIAWDGQHLWVSDQSDLMIYRIDPVDGTPLSAFPSPGTDPKGLTWDGEFLWHVDQATQTIYKLESGVIPFGIIGCIEKNGKAVNGDVLLSQTAIPDQSSTTSTDGCFIFPSFTSGVPIQVKVSESGVDEKPVITLVEPKPGSTDVTLIVGDTYSEPGFTAADTEDGDISSSVVATPDVINAPTLIDTSSPNTTGVEVYYDVVDSAGNLADRVYRTVYVLLADTTPPVITLLGDNPMAVELGGSYVEPGATALDDRDGDITANITVSGSVDTNTTGSYTLTYDVSDETGNPTSVTRTINVSDTTAPTITLVGASSISLEKGDTFTDPGATASDNTDGDITSSIVKTGSVTTDTTGTYILTYDVSDAGGNPATTVTRSVQVSDNTAPVITLIGSSPINHELNTPFTDPGATAIDTPSQDISSSIVVTGSVNENLAGTYNLTYNVTDADGNPATSVTRQVIVSDTGTPSITLLGNNPIEHELGNTFTDPGATASDAIDGDISANIVIGGDTVNENLTGTYTITYDVVDSASNPAPTQTRVVNVSDTTPPTLTLLGAATIQHDLQAAYTDAGATASDNTDGDITANIVVGGDTVDVNTTGTYTITYNVSDASGNPAAPITRVVDVADRDLPVITLLGSSPLNHEVGTIFVDPGATAFDNIDGDITSSISVSGTVNANVQGSYTLTYRVTDSSGSSAIPVTRTVNVQDTGAPSITLLGSATVLHELQTTYTDAGATASDAADGDLTSSIAITGSVNSNVAGTYTLNYNVSDSQSNPAPTVSRTVIVADRTAPVITLTGSATVNVEQGSSYTDAGATASDIIDGNITGNITVGGSVNTTVAGAYTLTYNVSDAAGNAATQVSRTVIVGDTTAPVITLIGNNPLNHEVGTVFVDPGATATDNLDGNISSNINVTGSVNPNIIGNYTLSYNVSDSSGNPAATVTRTVNVADTGAPSIAINGASVINHELNTAFVDPGATASDAADGDLTSSIVVGGDTVNTSVAGTYIITYDVTDSGSNPAIQQTRTVNVNDFTNPVITLIGTSPTYTNLGDSYTDAGATATDNIDGDISANITTSGSVNISSAGSYTLSYNVADAAGNNATQVTRTVIVQDQTIPVISLNGSANITHQQGTVYGDAGATASDNIDGDLTSSITVTGFVNSNAAGVYELNYNVTDSTGNDAVTVTRTVTVADSIAPVLSLLGSSPISHEQGSTYTDAGATASDNIDGDISGSIVVTGSVDINTTGSYTLTYNVSDTAGNPASSVSRTVNVADNTAPVITLSGSTPINHQQGTTYTDAGATASDNIDGDISGAIVVTGSVNTAAAGSYTLTYNVVDTAGNPASAVTRTVNVGDTIPPVMSLVGDSPMDHTIGSLFVDPGVTATDNIDGDISADVTTSGSIDINTEGAYVLTYNVSDSGGNPATAITRTVNVVSPVTVSVEAETATIGGAHIVSTTNAGFTGSGYIEHSGEGYVEYTFNAFAVPYDLTVRFALDTGDRPLEVILNSVSLGNLAFPATGSFTTWGSTATFSITPNSGANTIRLQTTGSSGANIDQLIFTPQ
ncbi:MAG: immunoglobulin-like domain-containing protein [Oleiphilus sp.]